MHTQRYKHMHTCMCTRHTHISNLTAQSYLSASAGLCWHAATCECASCDASKELSRHHPQKCAGHLHMQMRVCLYVCVCMYTFFCDVWKELLRHHPQKCTGHLHMYMLMRFAEMYRASTYVYVDVFVCMCVCMYTFSCDNLQEKSTFAELASNDHLQTYFEYLHICLCLYVCMYTSCMYVCMCGTARVVYKRISLCMYSCMYVCMHLCTCWCRSGHHTRKCLGLYMCVYVCMNACTHV
jgi:hypothetical protein